VTEYAYLAGAVGPDVLTEVTEVMPRVTYTVGGIAVNVCVDGGGGAYRDEAY
jgi:hypothetical protein